MEVEYYREVAVSNNDFRDKSRFSSNILASAGEAYARKSASYFFSLYDTTLHEQYYLLE